MSTSSAGPNAADTTLSDRVVFGSLAFTLAANGASSVFAAGWPAASLIVCANWLAFVTFAVSTRSGLVLRLATLGLTAGFVELLADRWLVETVGTLVYEPGGPFLLRSPLYMPFAWGAVLVQTGYVAWRVSGRFGLVRGALLTAALGALVIPLYEWWARGAAWWHYRNARMIGPVPWGIVVGEAVCAGLLALLVRWTGPRRWWLAAAAGALEGLGIWGGYLLGFTIFG